MKKTKTIYIVAVREPMGQFEFKTKKDRQGFINDCKEKAGDSLEYATSEMEVSEWEK